ncbi:hypothetical protein [Pseudoalteromonas piscicida]
MKMKWLFSLLFISNLCWGSNQLVVDIISSENFSQRYEHFLAGRDVLDVDSFFPTTKGSHIEIIEMVLLQQALFLGGETRKVVFNPKPSVNILEFSDSDRWGKFNPCSQCLARKYRGLSRLIIYLRSAC